jgi:hypothetical protein
MSTSYDATRKLPLDQLPRKHRVMGEKAIEAHDARERNAASARDRLVEAILDDDRKQRHDLLGAKNAAVLREAMKKERVALKHLREPPTGLTLDVEKANNARIKRINALARSLGADPRKLGSIGRAIEAKVRKVLDAPSTFDKVTPGYNLKLNLAKWTDLSPANKLPLDWGVLPDPGDPWQVFTEPFPFWNLGFQKLVESDHFTIVREFDLFESIGVIGNTLKMDCNDADSFDVAQAIVDTEVVFIYQAPETGRVEVLVDAINTFSDNYLRIENEWGWSYHRTDQANYLSLNVFHPAVTGRSLSLMSSFIKEQVDDDTWHQTPLTAGNHYFGHMVSNGIVQAGDTFFVGVGTRTNDLSRANDEEVHSRSQFQWFIRAVEVRMATF